MSTQLVLDFQEGLTSVLGVVIILAMSFFLGKAIWKGLGMENPPFFISTGSGLIVLSLLVILILKIGQAIP